MKMIVGPKRASLMVPALYLTAAGRRELKAIEAEAADERRFEALAS